MHGHLNIKSANLRDVHCCQGHKIESENESNDKQDIYKNIKYLCILLNFYMKYVMTIRTHRLYSCSINTCL